MPHTHRRNLFYFFGLAISSVSVSVFPPSLPYACIAAVGICIFLFCAYDICIFMATRRRAWQVKCVLSSLRRQSIHACMHVRLSPVRNAWITVPALAVSVTVYMYRRLVRVHARFVYKYTGRARLLSVRVLEMIRSTRLHFFARDLERDRPCSQGALR